MAITKNKTDILDNQLSLRSALSDDYDSWENYYDEYSDYYGCGCPMCMGQYVCDSYEYMPIVVEDNFIMISKRGLIYRVMSMPNIGRMIDMETVYTSKEIIRDRKIDEILGLSHKAQKTLGSILNEEFRDIYRKLDIKGYRK